MKLFNRGDEVRLTRDVGKLKAGAPGLVVEVYEMGLAGKEADMDTLFDYAVIFPTDVSHLMTHQGVWLADTVSLDQFHAGDAVPIRESELELSVPGVEPRRFVLVPRDVLAVRWDANTGHDGAKALAKWIGGKFVFDEQHPEKTYYWSIEVSHRSGYFLRATPGKWILKHDNGDIRTMNPDTFVSTYTALEK